MKDPKVRAADLLSELLDAAVLAGARHERRLVIRQIEADQVGEKEPAWSALDGLKSNLDDGGHEDLA